MAYLLLLPCILCFALLGAHFLHHPDPLTNWIVAACVAMPFLLFIRRRPILWMLQALLVLAALEWISSAWQGMQDYAVQQKPVTRYLIIMGSVAAFNLIAALLMAIPSLKRRYPAAPTAPAQGFPLDKNENKRPT